MKEVGPVIVKRVIKCSAEKPIKVSCAPEHRFELFQLIADLAISQGNELIIYWNKTTNHKPLAKIE